MKKLNITKKQYEESKYFNKKYGSLKFVSESGKLFKTDKGVVLALEGTENQPAEGDDAQGAEGGAQKADESLKDIGNAIKDTAKELGSKAKAGLKKGAKAVANAFKGNFRKNDTVEISGGEDSDGNPVTLKGVVKDAGKNEVTIGISREAAESDDGDATEVGEDVTRGELTDILKDVVAEVEKVCDSQDISFESSQRAKPTRKLTESSQRAKPTRKLTRTRLSQPRTTLQMRFRASLTQSRRLLTQTTSNSLRKRKMMARVLATMTTLA